MRFAFALSLLLLSSTSHAKGLVIDDIISMALRFPRRQVGK